MTKVICSFAGSLIDPVTGQITSLPGCAQLSNITPTDPGGGCLWDTADFRSLTPSEKYLNFFSRGSYALSDSMEIFTELSYSKKETTFHNTPSNVSGTWGYPGGPVNATAGPGATMLGADHPDNELGVAARLRYSAFDVGGRNTYNDSEFSRFLVGLKGSIGEWDFETAYLHSETELVNTRTGFLRYSAVRTALTDPNSPVGYWRIGDNAGLNTQALYDFISPTIHANASTSLDMVDVKGSRSLMELPGGALGLAVGAEYRRQTAELTPQSFTDQGDIIGLGFSAYSGTEEVAVGYAELLAPVTETLELSGALRVDSYKDGETPVTPKFGVKWTPADWIALRATYAEGFRAPNPAEAGDGGSAGFSSAADPVRCPGGNPAPGNTADDCAANTPIAIITTPNPDLQPEESKSYTLGFVLQPTTTTSITVDAWEIKRTNEINAGSTAAAIAAGNVVRNDNLLNGVPGTGSMLAVSVDYVNSNATTVRGVDTDIRQTFNLGDYGKLNLDLQWTRTNLLEREEPDGTTFQYAGTHGNCDITNCIGTPKDRINFGTTWDMNAWSVSGIVNYIGSMDNIAFEGDSCANAFADGTDAPGGCEIPSFYSIDLSGRWKATDALELFASVQNVTDRVAPLDPLTYGAVNYNPLHASGAIGRYFTVGAKYTFN